MNVSEIVRRIKCIIAKQLFIQHPEIEAKLWGDNNSWTRLYYANTFGRYSNKEAIRKYVENHGQ